MVHWTEELFIENPELHLMVFEDMIERVPGEIDYLLDRLSDNRYKTNRILDMNCGIGRHSVELARRGIKMLGTDISPTYIEVAEEKAREAGVSEKTDFRVTDMRKIAEKLSDEEPFDGIICLQTALGYYDDNTEEDIICQCYKLVKPGGFFALDIANRDWLLQHYASTSHREVGDYRILVARKYDVWKSRNIDTWTYLRKKDDGNYEEVKTITLDCRLWSPHELISLFEKAGFKHKGIYSGTLTSPVSHELTSINTLEFLGSFHLLYIFGKS